MSLDLTPGTASAAFRQSDVASGDRDQGPIQRILEEAARATGCNACLVCAWQDGKLSVLATVGQEALRAAVPIILGPDASKPVEGRVVNFASAAPSPSLGFSSSLNSIVHFAAGERIAVDGDAYLIVLHDCERHGLSAAQTYVLRAHAAHLATLFELEKVRQRVDLVESVEVRERTQRLRLLESVAVHARDSIIITEAEPIDLPGPRIIYCNSAFTATTGYSADEVVGKTPRILQGLNTDPHACARIRQALSAWEPIEIELTNYRKNGSEFQVELSIVPVADDRGWFTHWVSVQRDITERKEAERLTTRVNIAEFENHALATEIQERKRVEAELLYTAFHDNLTRLRNRAFFMERLAAALERAHDETLTACAVMYLDLDQFKIVNDSLGHVEGDVLLKEVALRLRGCVRSHDTLARIGGDEFAILIEDAVELASPVGVAERIIEAMRAPVQLGRQAVFPSCSIGIVQVSDGSALPDDVIRDADIAMYAAKRAGYGDYAIFDASMRDDAVAQLTLQTDLRQAVGGGEFYLVYQPIVEPASGHIRSFEALLRWAHPTRGVVAPNDFIALAEDMGLIREIDRWVMRQSLLQLRAWQQRLSSPDLRMSLNTSAAEFADPDFITDLSAALDEFALQPQCIELEITEGIFLHPSPHIEATIAAVRALGVRIALDDFGTGFSSLSYINRYPIDTIKIDKSFIDHVCTDHRTRAIVNLIVQLGETLGLDVVAEGVELQEQADTLADIGCTVVQGYYFARPLVAEEATDLLEREERS